MYNISEEAISFRIGPDGPVQTIPKGQCAQLFRLLTENRPQPVTFRIILEETGIQQVNARMSDLRTKWGLADEIKTKMIHTGKRRGNYAEYRLSANVVVVIVDPKCESTDA